ncbi:MAG: TolC family protein [Bacteroidales bacterium]|jgi:outer membrane protein TolC|nr:TolC family protein [Bacteroidales bacterium]
MKNHFKTLFVGISCLGIISLKAQEPIVLSLDSAINYAIDHNKTLMNSRFSIDKSKQKKLETIAQGLPQVSASIDYTNFLGAEASLQMSEQAPPITIEFNPTSNFKASVSQLIFNGSYYIGIQLSNLAKTMAEQSYAKDELTVKEQVIQSYYMILASERILTIIKDNKSNATIIYEKTKHLADAGILEATDEKKLSLMVTSVDNAIKSTERQVQLGYNLLRLQLGLEAGQDIRLSSDFDAIAQKYIGNSLKTNSFNIENNLDYKLLSLQGEMAEKQVTMVKASNLPSLVAFYSYTEKIKEPLFDMTPKNVLGLTLSIPIFSSGQRYTQLNQAKIDLKMVENTKELVTEQISIQEQQLRYNYNNLLEQFETQKANVEIAKEVLNHMNLKYEQGLVSSLELTSANNEYLTAESNYTSTILQLLNAELSLRKINNTI